MKGPRWSTKTQVECGGQVDTSRGGAGRRQEEGPAAWWGGGALNTASASSLAPLSALAKERKNDEQKREMKCAGEHNAWPPRANNYRVFFSLCVFCKRRV